MQSKKKYNMRKIQKKEIKSKIKPFKPDKKEDALDEPPAWTRAFLYSTNCFSG